MTWHIDMFYVMESLSASGEGKYAQVSAFRLEGLPTESDSTILPNNV